jgi:carbon-monoxide dehydrogenase small subunit
MQVTMWVNGEEISDEIEGRTLLVHFLRDQRGLTGTHWGCDTSNCGMCVVWMDGEPVKSCTVLAAMAGGREVRTVEGLEQGTELDPVQQGFMACHGLQCGFCTPGMVMSATDLCSRNANPSESDVRHWLEGNICRCTGYHNIVKAIRAGGEAMKGAKR